MTTVNLQVGASTDDARESGSGTMDLTNNSVYLNDSDEWGGWRWDNVTVPNGATIDTATLQVYLPSVDYDDIEVDLYCEDEDNPGTFTSDANNISGRTRTSASVNESSSSTGTGWHSMPDVKTLVQEVVDRGGWASGQALVIIEDGLAGVTLRQRAYDSSSSECAKLDIDYSLVFPPVPGRVHRDWRLPLVRM